jgi:hypothetical protein
MERDDSLRQRSTIKIMMYSASREDLKTVLEWLHGSDESQWKIHTDLLSEAISELQSMARRVHRPEKSGNRSMESDFVPPGADEINTAIPHLTKMLGAMRSQNRPAAIKSGEAALALLPERA